MKGKVEGLTAALEELKLVSKRDKDRDNGLNHAEQKRQNLLKARSMKEVTDKLLEFFYSQEKGEVSCEVCGENFGFGGELDNDFTYKMICPKFSSLKRNIFKLQLTS